MSIAQNINEALAIRLRHVKEDRSRVLEGGDVVVLCRVVRPPIDEVEEVAERFGQPCSYRVRLWSWIDHAEILALGIQEWNPPESDH